MVSAGIYVRPLIPIWCDDGFIYPQRLNGVLPRDLHRVLVSFVEVEFILLLAGQSVVVLWAGME